MRNMLICAKCGTKAKVVKHPKSVSNAAGLKKKRQINQFHVICSCCNQSGEWFDSSRDKAISSWNKKQREIGIKSEYTWQPGYKVSIYPDPYVKTNYEGDAVLIEKLGEQDNLEHWKIKFLFTIYGRAEVGFAERWLQKK